MKLPRQKPAGKLAKASAMDSPAKPKKPAAANVAHEGDAIAPDAETMSEKKFRTDGEFRKRWIDNFARRLSAAEKGQAIDPDALDIVRSISVRNYFFKHGELPSVRMYDKGGPMKNALAVKSSDGLVDAERERILKAVCNFDRDFLKALIAAMDLCESGDLGYYHPTLFAVVQAYGMIESSYFKTPTLAELNAGLKKLNPRLAMDDRTLRDFCQRHALPLARSKRGRPPVIRK